ncbi:MAG: hypothetical protein ABF826_13910, partial [Komagataeibacter saccharivorans]|uniref:hypothetical protein n=1 Tax=Komagataeibacter saccharivorans TaxID=265959 RepID=UPI0039E87CD2
GKKCPFMAACRHIIFMIRRTGQSAVCIRCVSIIRRPAINLMNVATIRLRFGEIPVARQA